MKIEKFFKNFRQPRVNYSKFKERNKMILAELNINIQSDNSSNVINKEKNKTILNKLNIDIQSDKAKRNIKLKYSLYAIILLIVASLSIVFIVNLKSSGDIEKGIELSKIEKKELINYLSSETANNNFILEKNSVELIKDNSVSLYEINYQVTNPYYICGYIPCTNQEILLCYRSIMTYYQNHVLNYDVALNIFKQTIEKEYPKFSYDNNFDFDSIAWIKYSDVNNIKEINNELGLVFIYKVSDILVVSDKIENKTLNKEMKNYSICNILIENNNLLIKDTEFFDKGYYLIFGSKNMLNVDDARFNDFYFYTKDETRQFQTYIKIIEKNDKLYLIEQTNKITTAGEEVDILLNKYSIYKETFEACIIEYIKQDDKVFAIYDLEKYVNVFRNIRTIVVKNDQAEVILNVDEINCSLKYNAKGTFGYIDEGNLCYLNQEFITSKNQLVELCNEYGRNTFDEDNTENLNDLNTLLQSFDEDYFEEKNIIIFTFWAGNPNKYNITNCSIVDGTLNFDVIESYKEDDYFYTLESYTWLVILEVDKIETASVNTLNINHIKIE